MKIAEAATQQVVTIEPDATVLEAAKLMRQHHVGDVIVVEEIRSQRVPIGIITDRDIVVGLIAQGADPAKILVRDLAGNGLVTCGADDELFETLRQMAAHGVRRMPVLNDLGAIVGIISYDDVVALLSEELAALAVTFTRQAKRERHRRLD